MKKIWSISTTVRNPDRTRNFLKTLKELEGQEWNNDTQAKFQKLLIKNRYYGFGEIQFYNGLPSDLVEKIEDIHHNLSFDEIDQILSIKNYEGGADMRGRNSRKPLEKLGLTYLDSENKIVISSSGLYLLKEDYDISELMFRSFLKRQYPNPLDREMSNPNIYNIKPFVGIMHLINKVNKITIERNMTTKGISRIEFMIFGLSLINYNDIEEIADKIIEFRISYELLTTPGEQREFIERYKSDFLSEYTNINNINDYADNAIRYFRLTKYFYIRGGGFYIDLEPRRAVEIEKILETYDGSADEYTKESFIEYIGNISTPELPWDSESELKKILINIYDEVVRLMQQLGVTIEMDSREVILIKDNDALKEEIKNLRTIRKKLQDIALKNELQNIEKVDAVINDLKNIRHLDIKPSIALEKLTTIALNIINDAEEIKSNAPFGDDNEILFTAPANKPDIECYYRSFNSICEVTMLNSRSQRINEGQPVMRHLRDFEDISEKEENYAIFIAQSMHRDTINTFWIATKYEYEGRNQRIVPITIDQLILILETIKTIKERGVQLEHTYFKGLLDSIVNTEGIENSDIWHRSISEKIMSRNQELLQNI